MNDNLNIIEKKLFCIGKKYFEENIKNKWQIKCLKDNQNKALLFFFFHSFMRGRKDELSIAYFSSISLNIDDIIKEFSNIKIKNLKEIIEDIKACPSKNIIEDNGFNEIKQKNNLVKLLVDCGGNKMKNSQIKCLNNKTDILLVLDTIRIIKENEIINLYQYIIEKIKNENLEKSFYFLKSIYGVGDKIASYILRDILLLEDIQLTNKADIKYVFPIDTWIKQVIGLITFPTEINNLEKLKNKNIYKILKQKFNLTKLPFVSLGLWYIGYNSLHFAISFLQSNDFFSIEKSKSYKNPQ